MAPNHFQIARNPGNAILNAPAIRFQLGFTFTAAHADASLLARQVTPEPGESRQQMLKLRQFDLQLAFATARALGKDIQNQRRAVENFAIENFLEVSALSWRKFIVEDNRIDIGAATMQCEFIRLAFANESSSTGSRHLLQAIAYDFGSGGGSQLGKFLQ